MCQFLAALTWFPCIFFKVFMVSFAVTGMPFYYMVSLIFTLITLDIFAFSLGDGGIKSITNVPGIPYCDENPEKCTHIAKVLSTFFMVAMVVLAIALTIMNKLEDRSNRRGKCSCSLRSLYSPADMLISFSSPSSFPSLSEYEHSCISTEEPREIHHRESKDSAAKEEGAPEAPL